MTRIRSLLGRVGLGAVVAALALSAMARIVSANLALPGPTAEEADAAAEARHGPPGPSRAGVEEMELLLRDIARRDDALARREAAVALREQDLRVAREEIDRATAGLLEAERALEARMFASDGASEADLDRLTAIYEGMKPKDAAALFEAMDPDFAAGFLGRMSPESAAQVFSALPPLAAYAVSATIAGRNVGAATAPTHATSPAPETNR